MTHICIDKLIIIGSDNGLSPGRRQAIIRTNCGILLIMHLGINCNEIPIKIHAFSFNKSIWKCRPEMTAILSRPQWVMYLYQFCMITALLLQMYPVWQQGCWVITSSARDRPFVTRYGESISTRVASWEMAYMCKSLVLLVQASIAKGHRELISRLFYHWQKS